MLGAGGLAASAGVVLALVLPEAGEEAPSDVAGMVPEPKGVAVLRGVVKMEVAAGVLAEVAWTGKVLCVRWVVGPEEMMPVGVPEMCADSMSRDGSARKVRYFLPDSGIWMPFSEETTSS